MFTIGDLKKELMIAADGGGIALTNQRLMERAASAVTALIDACGMQAMNQAIIRLPVMDGYLACPSRISDLLRVVIDQAAVPVRSRHYEFVALASEVGLDVDGPTVAVSLVDPHSPIKTELLEPAYIVAKGTDTDKQLRLFGIDNNGDTLHSGSPARSGYAIPIQDSITPVTTGAPMVRHLEGVIKPATTGNVTLYAVNSDGKYRILATYLPFDTCPNYRLYKLQGGGPYDLTWEATASTWPTEITTAKCLVTLGGIDRAADDNEPCPIRSAEAVARMMQAIHFFNNGDVDKGSRYRAMAIRAAASAAAKIEPQVERDVQSGRTPVNVE